MAARPVVRSSFASGTSILRQGCCGLPCACGSTRAPPRLLQHGRRQRGQVHAFDEFFRRENFDLLAVDAQGPEAGFERGTVSISRSNSSRNQPSAANSVGASFISTGIGSASSVSVHEIVSPVLHIADGLAIGCGAAAEIVTLETRPSTFHAFSSAPAMMRWPAPPG